MKSVFILKRPRKNQGKGDISGEELATRGGYAFEQPPASESTFAAEAYIAEHFGEYDVPEILELPLKSTFEIELDITNRIEMAAAPFDCAVAKLEHTRPLPRSTPAQFIKYGRMLYRLLTKHRVIDGLEPEEFAVLVYQIDRAFDLDRGYPAILRDTAESRKIEGRTGCFSISCKGVFCAIGGVPRGGHS